MTSSLAASVWLSPRNIKKRSVVRSLGGSRTIEHSNNRTAEPSGVVAFVIRNSVFNIRHFAPSGVPASRPDPGRDLAQGADALGDLSPPDDQDLRILCRQVLDPRDPEAPQLVVVGGAETSHLDQLGRRSKLANLLFRKPGLAGEQC